MMVQVVLNVEEKSTVITNHKENQVNELLDGMLLKMLLKKKKQWKYNFQDCLII